MRTAALLSAAFRSLFQGLQSQGLLVKGITTQPVRTPPACSLRPSSGGGGGGRGGGEKSDVSRTREAVESLTYS